MNISNTDKLPHTNHSTTLKLLTGDNIPDMIYKWQSWLKYWQQVSQVPKVTDHFPVRKYKD